MPVAVFRVDAGLRIGAGHLVRCAALAQGLADAGWDIVLAGDPAGFAILPLPPWRRIGLVEQSPQNEAAILRDLLPAGIDLLVVDHYGRDADFEGACRPWARRILAVDDLCRRHGSDWLLDATPFREPAAYEGQLPAGCGLLLGGRHALLRPGFARARWRRRVVQQAVGNLLVSVGATDPGRHLHTILDAIGQSGYSGRLTIILAPSAPHHAEISARVAGMNGTVAPVDADMPALMSACDLAIGAGGVGLLERACLGLPSLLLGVADNQRDNLIAMDRAGAGLIVREIEPAEISAGLQRLLGDPSLRAGLAQRNAALCDGLGVNRVIMALSGSHERLRQADHSDSTQLLAWQRDPVTRRFARDPRPPDPTRHEAWFAGKLADPHCLFQILEIAGQQVGMVRLDWLAVQQGFEVSVVIDPQLHGRGYGLAGLRLARQLVPDEDIWAYVKPENQGSLRLFSKAGYVPAAEAGWYVNHGKAKS